MLSEENANPSDPKPCVRIATKSASPVIGNMLKKEDFIPSTHSRENFTGLTTRLSFSFIILMILFDLALGFAAVGPNPLQTAWMFYVECVLFAYPLYFLTIFNTARLNKPWHAILWVSPFTVQWAVVIVILIAFEEYLKDSIVVMLIMSWHGIVCLAILIYGLILKFKLTVHLTLTTILLFCFAVYTAGLLLVAADKYPEYVPAE